MILWCFIECIIIINSSNVKYLVVSQFEIGRCVMNYLRVILSLARHQLTDNKLGKSAYMYGMPLRPIAVANEFVRQFGATNDIDHLKLQKLTYFAQGWWLAGKGEELLFERPQVWRYGPVFKSIYNTLSGRGRDPIKDVVGANPFAETGAPTLEGADLRSERDLVTWIWQEYGNLTGPQLSDMTHALGTPWRKIAEEHQYRVALDTEIPEELDWDYFAGLARQRGMEPEPLHGRN